MDALKKSSDLVQLLSKMVAFDTVDCTNQATELCLDFVDQYLSRRGMHVVRHSSNELPSLVATTWPTKRPKLLLQAHLDVVPCPESMRNLVERDGKFIGRGTFDMKFATAIYLQLVNELQDELANYDFGIMLTCDEEVGGRNGAGYLIEQGYRAEVCILPDAGDNWQIEVTQKGVWIAKLIARGVAVHGSRPWEGDNAIHKLIAVTQAIQELFKDQHAKSDTLSINMISGGKAVNQVAGLAEATLDIRFMSRQSYGELSAAIKNLAVERDVEIDTIACIQPIQADLQNPLVTSFLELAADLHDAPIEHVHSLGNSDAHYFDEVGVPVILMRPDGGAAHSDSEWLDKASFEKFYELIKRYVQAEARISSA